MAYIDLAGFPLLDDSGVGWNPASVPIVDFAANASALQVHQQSIEADNLNHVPIVVDDGLLAAPAIESSASRRITRGEWNLHQQEIKRQYPLMTLPELRKFMAKKHSFFASEQQWKKKLAEWRLSKNLPSQVTRFIRKKAHRRLVGEEKQTLFHLNQEAIPMDKVKRHVQAAFAERDGASSPTGSTPDQLSYHTYESPQPQLAVAEPLQEPSGNTPRKRPVAVMVFWQAQDIDGLLATARRAVEMSTNGDYLNAKPMFMESLDGLSALLPPDQSQAIKVLEIFVKQAVANKDFDEATARLHTSYNDHKDKLLALKTR